MKRAKIGVCAANKIGIEIIDFIVNYNYPIKFVATCEKDSFKYEKKIAEICNKKNIPLYRKVNVNNPEFIEKIKNNSLDLMILAWWPSIIKKEAIESVKKGWINMHPSLLPYNRGKHPYYWAINEGTPFGVTLHFIDKGVDTGPILFQKKIPVKIIDTGESLYNKSLEEIVKLFKEVYSKITRLDFKPKKQSNQKATFHLGKMLEEHSKIDLDKNYRAKDLINRIRGRTFLQGDSSYFMCDDKKYRIKAIIEKVKE